LKKIKTLMKKLSPSAQLKETIILLEIEQFQKKILLHEEFLVTYENLKPVNLIKNKLAGIITAPDFKNNLINSLIGIASGYISKKLIVGNTRNPIKQLLGTLLQVGVTKLVSNNAEGIKSTGKSIFDNLFGKKRQEEQED